MNLFEAELLTLQHMTAHNLIEKGWKFAFSNKKNSYGTCNYTKKTIYLSKHLTPLASKESVLNTIVHEIAHALTPGAKHGIVWKRKFIELGGSGERLGGAVDKLDHSLHVSDKPFYKYSAKCPGCGKVTNKHRKLKYKYSCDVCSQGSFNNSYLLIFKANY